MPDPGQAGASARSLEQALAREEALRARVAELGDRLMDAEQRLARTGELELELRELHLAHREALERHRRVVAGLESSLSWRVTRPLRAAKGLLRRA